MTIKNFDSSRLRQEEARTFHEMFSGITALCTHEVVVPYQQAYVEKLEAYKEALKPDVKSQVTAEMTQLDVLRGQLFVNYRRFVRSITFHFDKQRASIAQAVFDIIRKYGEIQNLPYLDESGSLDDLLDDLFQYDNPAEGQEPSAEYNRLSVIDAKVWAEEIKRVNDLFKVAFLKRLQEQSSLVSGMTGSTRKALDSAYADVVRKYNAILEVFGDEGHREIVAQLNDLIDYQNAIIKARTGKGAVSGSSSTEDATTPSDPTTPEEGTTPDDGTTPETPDSGSETPDTGDTGGGEGGSTTEPTTPDDDEEVVG